MFRKSLPKIKGFKRCHARSMGENTLGNGGTVKPCERDEAVDYDVVLMLSCLFLKKKKESFWCDLAQ